MHKFAQAVLIRKAGFLVDKDRRGCLLGLLLFGLVINPALVTAQRRPAPKVLILHSYHFGYDWTEDIAAGIRSVFQENAVVADLQVEFMDARQHDTPADLKRLSDYYRYKFRNRKFNAIISSDNAALE